MGQDDDLLTESFSARKKCFTIFQRITIVSNIFFGLFAVLLVALGAIGLRNLKTYDSFYKTTIPAGLLVLGVILLVIIAVGLAGSFFKSTKLLLLYFILLFIVVICEFGVGGGAYTLRGQIPSRLEASWRDLSNLDRNSLQAAYNCCGWSSPSDFEGSSCPNVTNSTNTERYLSISNIFEIRGLIPIVTSNSTACESTLIAYYQNELYIVGTVGIVFASFQLLALISSIVVFGFIKVEQIRSKEERF